MAEGFDRQWEGVQKNVDRMKQELQPLLESKKRLLADLESTYKRIQEIKDKKESGETIDKYQVEYLRLRSLEIQKELHMIDKTIKNYFGEDDLE